MSPKIDSSTTRHSTADRNKKTLGKFVFDDKKWNKTME